MKVFFCVFCACFLSVNVAVAQSQYELQPPELRKAIEQWQVNCQRASFNALIYNKMQFGFDLPSTSDAALYDSIGQRFIDYYRTNDLMVIETAYQHSLDVQGQVNERIITQQAKGLNSEELYILSTQFQPFLFSEPLIVVGKSSYINPISKNGLGYYQFFLKSKRVDSLGDTIACYGFANEKDAVNRALEGVVDVNLQTSVLQGVILQNDIDADSLHFDLQLSFVKIDEQTIRPDVMQCSLKMPNRITKLEFPIVGQGKSQVTMVEGGMLSVGQSIDSQKDIEKSLSDDEQLTKMQKQLLDGYLPGGVIRVDYRKLIDYTNYEGLKLGIGLWTGDSISKRISAGGFFVHSFKRVDNNMGAGIKAKLSKTGSSLVSFHWSDAFGATGVVSFLNGYKPLSAEAFGRFLTSTMDRVVDYQLAGETNLAAHLKGRLNVRYADVSPQMHYRYVLQNDEVEQSFHQNEMTAQFCWQPQIFDNQRTTTGFFLNFSYGTAKQIEVEPYRRTEVQIQLSNRFYSRGTTSLRITAGQINGKIPTTLYYSSLGTMADWGIDIPYLFNTMKMNEFAADRLLLLNLRHEHQLSIGERFRPCLAFTQNLGYGDVDASGLATFNRGFWESGLAFNNLLHLGIFQYGCSFHYRYGCYRLPDFGQNFVFKFNIGIDAF